MTLTKNPIIQTCLTVFTILLLSLTAAVPIIRSLPCSDDVAFHLLRLTELDFLLRNGVFYSRWAPNMAQGYGFPLFNFYAPLSYYAAELISLVTPNLNIALRWTFFSGVFLSGLTMYRLSRDHFSQPASFVAAVAYMYAPYHGYDIYFRGNLAESFAWWLLPLSLWSIGRLATQPRPLYFILTTLTTAAILLTHNAFALVFCPIIAAYGLFIFATTNQQVAKSIQQILTDRATRFSFFLLPFALLLALTLTAFFWLPALIERNIVHSDRLLIPPIFVYWGNFVTLSELFAFPRLIYTDLLNPSPPRALGLVQVILALPALALLFPHLLHKPILLDKSDHNPLPFPRYLFPSLNPTFFFFCITILYTFLMLEPSRLIWETVPLLEFVQFPWRLLGCVAVGLAFLSAAGTETLIKRFDFPSVIALVAIILIILSTLFWFAPRYCQGLEDPTIADLLAFERDTQTIGTTAKGEYIPLTADVVPPYTEHLFEPNEQIAIANQERTPKQFTAQLTADQPTTLIANTFYYPGWVATINGQPADLTPRDSDGLISLNLPSGTHDITITFTETPLRRTANAISLITLFVLIAIPIFYLQQNSLASIPSFSRSTTSTIRNNLLFLLLFSPCAFFLRLSPLATSYTPSYPDFKHERSTVPYQDGLVLLDYQLSARTSPSDEPLLATMHFKANRPLTHNIVTLLQVIDEDGRVWSGKESPAPRVHRGFYDSTTWPLNEYAEDMRLATLFPAAPPGLYTVQLIVFDRDTLVPLLLDDGRTTFDLGTVQLTRPSAPPEIEPQHATTADLGDFTLLGYDLDRTEAHSGDPFSLSFYWQADTTPTQDYNILLELVDQKGKAVLQQTLPPVRMSFPTTSWQAGDIWRGQHTFRLPAALETADYSWQICLNQRNDHCMTAPTSLGSLSLTAPDRTFDLPPLDIEIDQSLGEFALLRGVTLSTQTLQPATSLELALVWQPLAETPINYRVFVQLLDSDGRPVAVSDGEPAVWTRPTTSWLPDEIITDSHILPLPESLPAGQYTLIAGLYDPASGQRLLATRGQDALTLFFFD